MKVIGAQKNLEMCREKEPVSLKLAGYWDTGKCGRDKVEELVRSFYCFERRFCYVDQASLESVILLLTGGISGMRSRTNPS